jgi:hypothetical protein
MNLEQIINEINKDLDDTQNNGDLIGWINRCMDDLSPIAKKEGKKTAEVSPLNAYELPKDVMEVVSVIVNKEEYDRTQYIVWGNVLSLTTELDSGTIDLYYYRRLVNLTGATDEIPEIEPSFHDLFVLYTIAHQQFMEDEPERELDAMERYRKRKSEYEAFMQRNSTRPMFQTQVKNVYL